MIIEPKKNYKQNVKRSYKITHAVLNRETAGAAATDLLLSIGEKSYIACTLTAGTPQCALNLKFSTGDQIAFSTRGEGAIHLTGFTFENSIAPAQNGAGKKLTAKQERQYIEKLLNKTMSDEDSDDMDYSAMLEDYDGLGDGN